MDLYVFNPEHELAIANNNRYFTPPKIVKELHKDLELLPALFAKKGDGLIVDNVNKALEKKSDFHIYEDIKLIDKHNIDKFKDYITRIIPWGWDYIIKDFLCYLGINNNLLPDNTTLDTIKKISHRNYGSYLLNKLLVLCGNDCRLIGKSIYTENIDDFTTIIKDGYNAVIKAPWSCSGRGLRFIKGDILPYQFNWAKNIIKHQGGIMIEPLYEKVVDFAMEFISINGDIRYEGLSIFSTNNGAYTGNLIINEDEKLNILEKYIDILFLKELKEKLVCLLNTTISKLYNGPLGVDMMIVKNDINNTNDIKYSYHYLIHPLVEINFRFTMGHIAIAANKKNFFNGNSMYIKYDGSHHHIKFNTI